MAKTDEADRMRLLLIESITTLCRSGINYSTTLKVEGLLAITIDQGDVMVVNVNREYEVPGAKKSVDKSELDSVESGRTTPTGERTHRESTDSSGAVSPGRTYKRTHDHESSVSSPRKISRRDISITENVHIEGNWSVSDNSRDSPHPSIPGQSHFVDRSQSYSGAINTHAAHDKAEIKIEIMDSDSEQEGDSSLHFFDELHTGEGQLVHMPGSEQSNVSMYGAAGYSQPVAGPSNPTSFSHMLPTQTMGTPTVGVTTSEEELGELEDPSSPEQNIGKHSLNLLEDSLREISEAPQPSQKKRRKKKKVPAAPPLCECCAVVKRRQDIIAEINERRKIKGKYKGMMIICTGQRRERLDYQQPIDHVDKCQCCELFRDNMERTRRHNANRKSRSVSRLALQASVEKMLE